MKTTWLKSVREAADPRRTKHCFELLAVAGVDLDEMGPERLRILAALFSGSEALGSWLIAHGAELAALEPDALKFPRRKQGLVKEVGAWFTPLLETGDYATAITRLRDFNQRERLRIAARDLARLGGAPEITRELSDLADVCLALVWDGCRRQLTESRGRPWHQDAEGDWHPTAGCVIGLGKLGGQELNYSSDVDVIFVYAEEGKVFKEPPTAPRTARSRSAGARSRQPQPVGRPVMTNHQFFNRLAEAFIAEVTRLTSDGTFYRIDLRLRPEGDGGPLTRSLAGYENYYAQWGQTWERMMLIKARPVAGEESLGAEFIELVQPFRFPRFVNSGVMREVGAMKDRIESEVVKTGELDRNVKLGRGGIREIEFITQALQLLHAGRQPFLQGSQTLPSLEKLAQYELLPADEARMLSEAYVFLRDVEHRLQMEANLQTHTIPANPLAEERLARLMGFRTRQAFARAHLSFRTRVRRTFERLLGAAPATEEQTTPFPRNFAGAEAEWKTFLAAHGFQDPEKAFRVLREFVEGPGYVHVSPRTRELAFRLLPRLFALCPQSVKSAPPAAQSKPRNAVITACSSSSSTSKAATEPPLSDPDRVVTRLDSFIAAYRARATLFEVWNSTPAIFDLLVLLFDRSEFLAELAIRTPDLVDELVTSGRLRQRKTAPETLADLRHGLGDADQHGWLRRYHQAELMRIGLRDILGLADPEQYLTEISALADACLQYAVEVGMRRRRLRQPPFAVIGLGKLGGAEIDYGSDLDIVFVTDSKAKSLTTLAGAALEVMELLSARTEQGLTFHTDARLRPDGEKGLLVNTMSAYEVYYRERAQLWEIQSLTRTRVVAGDLRVGEQFQKLAATLSNFRTPSLPLAAFSPEWKQKIHQMRLRIETERTPKGKDDIAIKTGRGGLMDAEFVAQGLCLENGWAEPNTLAALGRGREAGRLPEADKLVANFLKLRRVEGILRRWSYEGEIVLPDDPAPYRRVAVRCGFENSEAFRRAIAEWRQAIRDVYSRVFTVEISCEPATQARS